MAVSEAQKRANKKYWAQPEVKAKRKAYQRLYMRKRRTDPAYKIKELAWKRKGAGVDLTSITKPQPANCEVCGIAASLQCDHDHQTGKFRGWLCGPCNRTLGIVKDNPVILERLAGYLRG